MPADEFSFDITPQDAIDYLKKRRKTELSWHWSDVQKQEHMRAFTVAKMTSATLLDDVRKSLDKAMAEGQSFQEWRKDIIPKLQGVWLGKTYGDLWDGMTPAEQAGKTPPTPEERDRVIKASRLETIFRTNMFNAYAAGRYRQLKEDADIYPYWRYVTAKDSAVRPAHRALEGKVFKADDPFWSTHYPPNGFNCRCIVEAVDEYDLEMQDLKVQEGGNTYFDEENGQTVYRDAEGKEYPCDKGWDYNVGEDTTGKKTLASKKFPPELTKAVREDLKAEAERLKAEAEEQEKARKQAEEESRRADAAQKAAAEAKKQAEAEAKRKAEEQRKAQAEAERKAEEQRKAQAEAERKAKEQSKKAETEQKRFVVDVTRPSKPSKHPAKKAATDEQKRFVVDVTRPDKPSKRPGKKAAADEQKRFVVDVTRPDKPSKRPGKKAATDEQKRFVVDVTRPKAVDEFIKAVPDSSGLRKSLSDQPKELLTTQPFNSIKQIDNESELEAAKKFFEWALNNESKLSETQKVDQMFAYYEFEQKPKITEQGKQAFWEYSGDWYKPMNSLLRDGSKFIQDYGGQPDVVEKTKLYCADVIQQLSELIIPEGTVLRRTAGTYELLNLGKYDVDAIFSDTLSASLFVKRLNKWINTTKKTKKFPYKAFTSTTISKDFQFEDNPKWSFTFATGKNVHGAYIGPGTGMSKYEKTEKEVLLIPGIEVSIISMVYNAERDCVEVCAILGDF